MRSRRRFRSRSCVQLRAWQQPAVLAEPRTAKACWPSARRRRSHSASQSRRAPQAGAPPPEPAAAAAVDRDSRRDRRRPDMEDRVGTGRATTPTARSPATTARCCSRTTTRATSCGSIPATGLATVIHKDMNTGGARVAQQERRAVPRVARPERRHPAARAAAQGACEHLQRRAARLRRRRAERPRRPTAAAASTSAITRRRRVLRRTRRVSCRNTARTSGRERHHPERRREDALCHERRRRASRSTSRPTAR